MPIGTSDGKQYTDEIDMLRAPFGVSAPVELPQGTLQGQVLKKQGDKLIDTVSGAATLAHDVMSGEVPSGSLQEIERATQLAGLMVAGPAPVAKSMADGTLGSFAGVRSATADVVKLQEAQNMKANAVHPDDVWKHTGWFQGADNRWKYEIPDQKATLNPKAFDMTIETSPEGYLAGSDKWTMKTNPRDFFGDKKPIRLNEVFEHPELFKAYPDLAKIKIEPMPPGTGYLGLYSPSTNTISLNSAHPDQMKSVLLHEIQHAVQLREGFGFAEPPQMFRPSDHPNMNAEELKVVNDKAFSKYQRYAGEVESRNVQARMHFGELRRQLNPPVTTEDVPRFMQGVIQHPAMNP